jgi:hypothetical protein
MHGHKLKKILIGATTVMALGVLGGSSLLSYAKVPSKSQKIESGSETKKPDEKNSARWRAEMLDLYKTLIDITTLSSSDRKFNARMQKKPSKKVQKNWPTKLTSSPQRDYLQMLIQR